MSNEKYWLCCGSTDSYHGTERVGQCTEAISGSRDRCRFGTKEDHKEFCKSGTDKALAAIKTLEHLGYEYNGGEHWKPPMNGDVSGCGNKIYWRTAEEARQLMESEQASKEIINTYGSLRNEIIKEYLDAQQSRYK